MNQLSVKIDLEDYCAGLHGQLEIDGFKGRGEGWFNISDIQAFANELEQQALSMEGKVELLGGNYASDGSGLELELFAIRSYIISEPVKLLGFRIHLSEQQPTDYRRQEFLAVSGELLVEAQCVLNFVNDLRKMCRGEFEGTTLVGRN